MSHTVTTTNKQAMQAQQNHQLYWGRLQKPFLQTPLRRRLESWFRMNICKKIINQDPKPSSHGP